MTNLEKIKAIRAEIKAYRTHLITSTETIDAIESIVCAASVDGLIDNVEKANNAIDYSKALQNKLCELLPSYSRMMYGAAVALVTCMSGLSAQYTFASQHSYEPPTPKPIDKDRLERFNAEMDKIRQQMERENNQRQEKIQREETERRIQKLEHQQSRRYQSY